MHAIPPKLIAAPITMIRQLLLSPIIKIKPPINIKSIPSIIIIQLNYYLNHDIIHPISMMIRTIAIPIPNKISDHSRITPNRNPAAASVFAHEQNADVTRIRTVNFKYFDILF